MSRPMSAGLTLLALAALLGQIALPAVHQMHDSFVAAGDVRVDEATHGHHHHHHHGDAHHDHDEDADHDASHCPTCQLFASLRAFTPLTANASGIVVAAQTNTQPFTVSVAPTGRIDLTLAAPRAPPVC